mgnify:CR=1 FL=1
MSIFIKYECGCIGFQKDRNDSAIIFCPCDADPYLFNEDIMIIRRNMEGKDFSPLEENEEDILLDRLRDLIHDGYSFHELKNILRR